MTCTKSNDTLWITFALVASSVGKKFVFSAVGFSFYCRNEWMRFNLVTDDLIGVRVRVRVRVSVIVSVIVSVMVSVSVMVIVMAIVIVIVIVMAIVMVIWV